MEKYSLAERIRLIFSVVDTDGKEAGTVRAADVYQKKMNQMQMLYNEIQKILKEKKDDAYDKAELLQELEKQKEVLEKRLQSKANILKTKYSLPEGVVKKLLPSKQEGPNWTYYSNADSGQMGSKVISASWENIRSPNWHWLEWFAVWGIGPAGLGIVELVYQFKKRKFENSEKKGFEEARKIYKEAIKRMEDNLLRLQEREESEGRRYTEATRKYLGEIAELEDEISQLEIAICIS